MLSGTVSEFSDAQGLGSVTGDDGRTYLFHVIEIADGSRTIEVGRSVWFRPLAKFGTFQAGTLVKV